MPADRTLLRRIDAYLDAAPRTGRARTEVVGPFTIFLGEVPGWRYYARPTPGAPTPGLADVRATRARQRELGEPESFEWVEELHPGLAAIVADDELRVVHHPLMVFEPHAARVRGRAGGPADIVEPDEDLAVLRAVAELSFADPGTAIGAAGLAEAAANASEQDRETTEYLRDRMFGGRTVAAAARVGGDIVAVGWHQPLDGASEIVGVATLPAFRRRGLGGAVTAALVGDAVERGIGTIFLSADDDDVARVYERVGFRRVGTAGAGSPA